MDQLKRNDITFFFCGVSMLQIEGINLSAVAVSGLHCEAQSSLVSYWAF